MSFINKYPYTDYHELNADYLYERVKAIEEQLANIKGEIEADILVWFDGVIKPYQEELDALVREVSDLKEETEETLADYDTRITNFINDVNNALAGIRAELISSIDAVNALTDLKIQTNNVYLINQITENVGNLFLVQNPFDGETISIQEMVDILADFHITDGIDYDTMATRALTYNQFNALNISYTDLTMHGNTLYT